AIRVGGEGALARERILVHAHATGGIRGAEREGQPAVAVADDDDVARGIRLGEDQPVARVRRDEVMRLDVGPAAQARGEVVEGLDRAHALALSAMRWPTTAETPS